MKEARGVFRAELVPTFRDAEMNAEKNLLGNIFQMETTGVKK